MDKPVKLRVRPNPYFSPDPYGRPAGLVRVDPSVGRPGTVEFVGAKLTKRDVNTAENKAREPMYRRRETVIEYVKGAVEIVKTELHMQAVRTGALLAEDKETARECKIWFVAPDEALKQAKAKFVAEWRASHGEDPPEETVDPPQPDKPAVAASAEEPLLSPFLTPEMLAEQSATPAPEAAKQAAPAAEVK